MNKNEIFFDTKVQYIKYRVLSEVEDLLMKEIY